LGNTEKMQDASLEDNIIKYQWMNCWQYNCKCWRLMIWCSPWLAFFFGSQELSNNVGGEKERKGKERERKWKGKEIRKEREVERKETEDRDYEEEEPSDKELQELKKRHKRMVLITRITKKEDAHLPPRSSRLCHNHTIPTSAIIDDQH